MFTISKRFHFAASHQLSGLVDDHQCARLHGHSYEVELEMASGVLDEIGMVFDYGDMAPFKGFIDGVLDHRHLNDVVDFNPTAELLAQWLYMRACELLGPTDARFVTAVRVYESPRTCAEFRP